MPRRDIDSDYSEQDLLSISLPTGLDGSTSLPGTLERRKKGKGKSDDEEDGVDGSMPSKPLMRGTRYACTGSDVIIPFRLDSRPISAVSVVHTEKWEGLGDACTCI